MSEEEEIIEEGMEDGDEPEAGPTWNTNAPPSIFIDTGRGDPVEVAAGSSFGETIERVADEVHYGGYFRVFLNGSEVINPEDAPATIDPGMRIILTAYDKVG